MYTVHTNDVSLDRLVGFIKLVGNTSQIIPYERFP